ncbi:stage II sporulation protein M, partial [Candidatus Woesearchaeota archaeon]|nr:stage II sporulation protein M [Candidatus Woesearchaeota archaeon]
MVFESIVRPIRAVSKPWQLFFFGIMVASIGLFIGYWIFRDKADLVMIFLTAFACIPLMFHAIRNEEKEDIKLETELSMLKKHSRVLLFYTALFLGMVVAYSTWYVVLPTDMSHTLFQQQITTIAQINAPYQPNVVGDAVHTTLFNRIFFNNIKVMIFCVLFAFFYGAGAIFILAWNASVVAAAVGNLIKLGLVKYIGYGGFAKMAATTQTVTYSFGRYLFHGVPEMMAYMVAGLAGGIISVAVINKHFKDQNFQKIILDASTLLMIAIAIVFIAAVMESYITP